MPASTSVPASAPGAPLLRLDRVGAAFGAVKVLDDLTLDVRAGEFVALVGPSGCGKTTLLNVCSGWLAPTSGAVHRPARLRMVFQQDGLFPWLTVEENITLGVRHITDEKERARRSEALLALIGLLGFAHVYPHHAKDIWPRFISCVLVVTEDLIAKRPAVVKDLVRGIAESGEWAEAHRVDAARLVSPHFRQDEKLVRHVLTQPPDRVSYRMLTPGDDEMQKMADMAYEAKILDARLDVRGLVDRQFIPAEIEAARITLPPATATQP